MKCAIVLLLALPAAMDVFAVKKDPAYRMARQKGAQTKMELRIEDDGGSVVADADVSVFMGMNFREHGYWIKGRTDTNGVFNVEGKTCGDAIAIYVSKRGHYDSTMRLSFVTMGAEREVIDGKWQPYGTRYSMILRRILNPQAIEIGCGEFVLTKHLNRWVSFDMQKHDFVYPFGTGETADFDVRIEWDGKWLPDYTGMGISIRFTVPYSGYYELPKDKLSRFKGPYAADKEKTFCQTANFYEKVVSPTERIRHHLDESKAWVVRSRCKIDEYGNLISANYSVVYNIRFCGEPDGRGGFRITGAFNPTPNDMNLEPKNKTNDEQKRGT